MNAVRHLSVADFRQHVVESPFPVLVDFYAPWCGPCRALAPVLERLAAEYEGRVRIVKVNLDDEPALADQFQVQSIPTLAFFIGGELVGKVAGLLPEPGLRQALDRLAGAAGVRRAG